MATRGQRIRVGAFLVIAMGVPIGKVTNIQVTNPDRAQVTVTIDPERVTLYRGVRAQLVLISFAAGTMAVGLEGGDPAAGELPPGAEIDAAPSTLTAVSSRVEEMLDDFDNIVVSLSTGLAGMEEGQLTRMVEDADALIKSADGFINDGRELVAEANDTLRSVRGDVEDIIRDVREVSDDVERLVKNTDEFLVTARQKVEPLDLAETERELQRLLENTADLSERINIIASHFDETTKIVLHQASNVEYAVRQGVGQMAEALERVQALASTLQEDPSALLRGRGQPREN